MTKKQQDKKGTSGNRNIHFFIGLLFLVFSILLFLSFFSFLFTWQNDIHLTDAPNAEKIADITVKVSNWIGKLGLFFANTFIINWIGVSAFFTIPIFFIIGMRFWLRRILPFRKTTKRLLFIIFWLSITLGYFFTDTHYILSGKHGYYISQWLISMLGKTGTALFIVVAAIAILMFLFETLWLKIAHIFKTIYHKVATPQTPKTQVEPETADNEHENPELEIENANNNNSENSEKESLHNKEQYTFVVERPEDEDYTVATDEEQDETVLHPISPSEALNNLSEIDLVDNRLSIDDAGNSLSNNEIGFEIETTEDEELLEDTDIRHNLEKFDPKLDLNNYKYPTLALLPKVDTSESRLSEEEQNGELRANEAKIIETLANYDIKITNIKATIGPTITLYEIIPAPGVRISKIKGLENDIALSLAALGIRIIAPIPGKGTIGIEVPNQRPEIVSMRSVLASKKFQETKFDLPVVLGKTITNETYMIDLVKMPHLLVAGATGQGKSVGLNAVLISLLYKKHPAELKLVLIDPKKVELTLYNKLEKHFLASIPDAAEPIITDTQKVINTLNSLCIEMDQRYDLLKAAHVRTIKEYNEKFVNRHLNPLKGHRYLPYIVVVIDEYADLIMTAGKEIEMPIARLAQLARAIGIHLIIATQRPTTNIITGIIKANFPARIAFRVMSGIDSKTILDQSGANQLIGRGDMLVSPGGELVRVQCAFIDTPEVEIITDHVSKQQSYTHVFELPEYVGENSGGLDASSVDLSQKDPLFEEAARLMVIHQQGSTSLIQRKFSIGYNRAGRIVDQLEVAGVLGPFEGSKARQVLIPDEYALELLLKNLK